MAAHLRLSTPFVCVRVNDIQNLPISNSSRENLSSLIKWHFRSALNTSDTRDENNALATLNFINLVSAYSNEQ